jgi:hypothetical protein
MARIDCKRLSSVEQDLFYSAYILSVFSNTDKTINPDDDSGLSVLSAIAAAPVPVADFKML